MIGLDDGIVVATRGERLKGGRVLVWWSGEIGNERESTSSQVGPVPEHGTMGEPGLTGIGPGSAYKGDYAVMIVGELSSMVGAKGLMRQAQNLKSPYLRHC